MRNSTKVGKEKGLALLLKWSVELRSALVSWPLKAAEWASTLKTTQKVIDFPFHESWSVARLRLWILQRERSQGPKLHLQRMEMHLLRQSSSTMWVNFPVVWRSAGRLLCSSTKKDPLSDLPFFYLMGILLCSRNRSSKANKIEGQSKYQKQREPLISVHKTQHICNMMVNFLGLRFALDDFWHKFAWFRDPSSCIAHAWVHFFKTFQRRFSLCFQA